MYVCKVYAGLLVLDIREEPSSHLLQYPPRFLQLVGACSEEAGGEESEEEHLPPVAVPHSGGLEEALDPGRPAGVLLHSPCLTAHLSLHQLLQ